MSKTMWLIICSTLMFFFLSAPSAQAHPHVFVEQHLNVVFDAKGLAGIKVRWQFDDMYSSMIIQDYDYNRNGRLEGNEIAAIREKVFSATADKNYFCFIKIDNKPFEVKYVKDFKALLEDGVLVYEFFIPCTVSASSDVRKVTVATYDPTYYTAILFADNSPITLTSAAAFVVKTSVREDTGIKFYYNQISPWSLYFEFRRKK